MKFKKGDYACINRLTAKHVRETWPETLNAGGYIQVTSVREGYYSPGYAFSLFNSAGKVVDVWSTSGAYFDKAPSRDIPVPKSSREQLEAQIAGKIKEVLQLQETINKRNSEKSELQTRLDYLTDNGLESFNEKEFQAYRVLQVIEERDDLSRMEKAKLIAEIVR